MTCRCSNSRDRPRRSFFDVEDEVFRARFLFFVFLWKTCFWGVVRLLLLVVTLGGGGIGGLADSHVWHTLAVRTLVTVHRGLYCY